MNALSNTGGEVYLHHSGEMVSVNCSSFPGVSDHQTRPSSTREGSVSVLFSLPHRHLVSDACIINTFGISVICDHYSVFTR